MDTFHKSLRQNCFFNNKETTASLNNTNTASDTFDHWKFKNKTNWSPVGPPNLEAFITINELKLNETIPRAPKFNNLPTIERLALDSLAKNDTIVIKPADKGSAVVILNKTDYIREAISQLTVEKYYLKQEENKTLEYFKQICDTVANMETAGEISKKCRQYLTGFSPKTARFYLLPKIHKPQRPPPGRPIKSANQCPTERISELVNHCINPLVSHTKSYVKDKNDFLKKIITIKESPTGDILATLDVTSLYSNKPNNEGITAVQTALSLHYKQKNPQLTPL